MARRVCTCWIAVDGFLAWWEAPERAGIRAALDECAKVTVTIVEGV
jgi:hypothetical protein